MNFANAGLPVTILEVDEEALQRGFDLIRKNYQVTVSKGKMNEAEMEARLKLMSGTTRYSDLADADIVIEAVFEDLGLKKTVFGRLDDSCKPGAILATNTSYQDVNEIACATGRPQDVVGLHFFSPANVMKLLEVVRGGETADDVLATVMKLAKTIGKIPALSGVCYGFIGNRMLRYYGRQAQLCLIEGGTPAQIDGAMQNFGMAMGPLAVYDLAGLDVGYRARQALSDEEKGDPKAFCIPDALAEMGRYGQKTSAGYYRYDPSTRARLDDPDVMDLVIRQASEHGVKRKEIDNGEIVERLVYALVNEGARILEEGIAQRSGDIDVVYVFGYGFPVARGGPMHYADHIGLNKVYETICDFRDRYGEENWTPAPLLEQLAKDGGTFAGWAP
jgi:3-hydroxyacyl-CoA dehydrogenase